jgi:oligopeptide transport system substrate-binding protein
LLVVALAAGCGGNGGVPAGGVGAGAPGMVVLHRGNGTEPKTLDQAHADETTGVKILFDLYEALLNTDADANLLPGVAERWRIADDALTYTFDLRRDARWSNGDPVTAEDFVAAFRRMVNPATASPNAQFYAPFENARHIVRGEQPVDTLGARAVDAHTLELRLETPTPWFLDLLATRLGFPIHRASLEEYGEHFARPGTLIGNGAYVLAEWVVQGHIRLERNPYYWNSAVLDIDQVYYYPTEDQSSEFMRYRAGELHYTWEIPNQRYAWIKDNMGEDLRVGPYLGVYFFSFDVTEPPFDDVRVRQALSMALDRETVAQSVVGTGEIPAYNLVPEYISNYEAAAYEWRDWPEERRLEEAQRLYAEAGYGPENPLSFTITYNTSANHRKIVVALASLWNQALSTNVSVLNLEWKVLLEQRRDRSNWEMLRMGWIGGWQDPYGFLEILLSGSPFNDSGFDDPAYDALLLESSSITDPEARRRALTQAESMMLQQYPVLPLYFYVTNRLVSQDVNGYRVNILDRDPSRLHALTLAP